MNQCLLIRLSKIGRVGYTYVYTLTSITAKTINQFGNQWQTFPSHLKFLNCLVSKRPNRRGHYKMPMFATKNEYLFGFQSLSISIKIEVDSISYFEMAIMRFLQNISTHFI